MFLLLNWLLGAGGSISSYGWVQLRVQQQMGVRRQEAMAGNTGLSQQGARVYPEILGSNPNSTTGQL